MNKDVYKHLLNTYGRNPAQWVGFAARAIHSLVARVYVPVVMAQITSSIASGNLAAAKRYTFSFFMTYVTGSIIGALGELLSVHTENKQYGRLMMAFYQKLVGKDVAFYRDHQTGYLASMFRQYLDSAMSLIRFFRGEALGTFVALLVPPIILFFASPGVGMIVVLVVVIQFLYLLWSSSKAHQYRQISHEIYRKVTGEVSDVITNIIAFKAGGVEARARSKMAALVKQETVTFELRRRTTTLLDLPRNIITACGITASVLVIISHASGLDPASLGLIVLTLMYMFQIVRIVNALPEHMIQHDDLITKMHPALNYLSPQFNKQVQH